MLPAVEPETLVSPPRNVKVPPAPTVDALDEMVRPRPFPDVSEPTEVIVGVAPVPAA